ncbi:MAG: hypothetical protein M3R15_09760 [Acidobacteriota bacterium]|nr:hypothetical protein [Acidobacteriota bacterium]
MNRQNGTIDFRTITLRVRGYYVARVWRVSKTWDLVKAASGHDSGRRL